jgi:Flp pilus assembly protein TadG
MATMKTNSDRPRTQSERGAELIEFALVFPLLLLVVLGMVDFGFLFQRMEVVTNAAREGARIAVLPGYAASDVTARVQSYLTAGGVPTTATNPVVTIDSAFSIPMPAPTAAMSGKRVTVTYTYQYLFLGPFAGWFGGSFTTVPIAGVAVMRDEVAAAP